MANVTKYTFNKLCRKAEVNKEISLEMFLEHIYDDEHIYFILNKQEIKFLFNYKNILEDEERYIFEFYQYVPERLDQFNYVFETTRKMKYHLFNECPYLASDYVDFRIPDEIKELGEETIVYYRNWFKVQGYAEQFYNHTLSLGKVVFDYNSHFPSRFNVKPLNEDYALIMEIPNSHKIFIDSDFDYCLFIKNINHLKISFENIFSCKVSRTLSKFQYLLNASDSFIVEKLGEIFSPHFVQNYGIENVKEKLRASKKIKFDLIEYLLEYFKWTYKFDDKSFDSITLEKFGLECCGGCKMKQQENVLKEILK